MTRYTNLGRKRTYLEAGFPEGQQNDGDEAVTALKHGSDQAASSDADTRPAKKHKRTKHKAKKDDALSVNTAQTEDADEAVDADATKEGGRKEEDQEVRNAYMNRDKNRTDEVARVALSEKRRQKRIQEKQLNTTCFACREKGHAARDCPTVKSGDSGDGASAKQSSRVGICYRCGSSKHTLSRCRKTENPKNPLPYASCFVCSGRGHLASSCPKNKNKGVYPNGGCCKLCGETSHLARNCPLRKQDNVASTVLVGTGHSTGADEDDFHTLKRMNVEVDMEERAETKAKRQADVKMGVMSKTIKSFATVAPSAAKKKVVVF